MSLSTKSADLAPDVQLLPHQQRVAEEAAQGPLRKLLLWQVGSGKSLGGLSAAEAYGKPYTVISPASLRPTWQEERKKFTKQDLPASIMSYTEAASGKPVQHPESLVMDEIQRLRNPGSKQTQRAMSLAEQAKNLILLSGTPTSNEPSEFAAPMSMLTGQPITPAEFRSRYTEKRQVYPGFFARLRGVMPREEEHIAHPEELKALLKGHIDYYQPDTPSVPVKHEDIHVEMSPLQTRLYHGMWNQLPWMTRWKLKHDFPMSRDELNKTLSFLSGPRQVGLSTLPYLRDKDPLRAFENSTKLQEANKHLQERITKDPRQQALVFSNFITAGLVPYAAALEKQGIPHAIFHGGLSDEERRQLVTDFNSGKTRVALLGPSGAEGLSFKGVQLIQLLDPYWHGVRSRQQEARGIRYGSHAHLPPELQNVTVQRFVSRLPAGFSDRLLSRLGVDRTSATHAADDYLEHLSTRKDRLNQEFTDILKQIGQPEKVSSHTFSHTHEDILPGGEKRILDVSKLWELVKGRVPEQLPMTGDFAKQIDRSRRAGFSSKRLAETDPNYPIILEHTMRLLDGRHRLAKLQDQYIQSVMAHILRPGEAELAKIGQYPDVLQELQRAEWRLRKKLASSQYPDIEKDAAGAASTRLSNLFSSRPVPAAVRVALGSAKPTPQSISHILGTRSPSLSGIKAQTELNNLAEAMTAGRPTVPAATRQLSEAAKSLQRKEFAWSQESMQRRMLSGRHENEPKLLTKEELTASLPSGKGEQVAYHGYQGAGTPFRSMRNRPGDPLFVSGYPAVSVAYSTPDIDLSGIHQSRFSPYLAALNPQRLSHAGPSGPWTPHYAMDTRSGWRKWFAEIMNWTGLGRRLAPFGSSERGASQPQFEKVFTSPGSFEAPASDIWKYVGGGKYMKVVGRPGILKQSASLAKEAVRTALGIPDRDVYGQHTDLAPGSLQDLFTQEHLANRAGYHHDIRLGSPDLGLLSWAARKGLPMPGQKHLGVRQPLHEHAYGKFEGQIPAKEYGGGTVKLLQAGKALITKVTPTEVHFTTAHQRYPERYALIQTGKDDKDKNWLLLNTTPTEPIPYEKKRYVSVPAEKAEEILEGLKPGSNVQAKIDGAASLVSLAGKHPEISSYRTAKSTNYPITHTERVFGGRPEADIPAHLKGSILRGELYGEREGKSIPPQELGGILNSVISKSLQTQKDRGIQLKNMLFDVQQYGKQPVAPEVPYSERRKMLDEVLKYLPGNVFHAPREEATTPAAGKALWQSIMAGQHPQTREGIVIHEPTGIPTKIKREEEHDVHIVGTFPAEGKYEGTHAGGLVYSHVPNGQPAGKIGTGFSDELRKDIAENPNQYIGRVAKVKAQEKLPSGALRAPVFMSLHEDPAMR